MSPSIRKKAGKAVGCVIFLCLAIFLYVEITYLFRSPDSDSRNNLTGIKTEENLDVVFVGASSVNKYWQPLTAWNEYGFTSYCYATSSCPAEAEQYYIAEVLRTQDPELIVIDLRTFLQWETTVSESGIRNGADSIDFFSINRWKMIKSYFEHRTAEDDIDIVSYYFDIAKYHSSYSALASETNWHYIDNESESVYKGWLAIDNYVYMEEPSLGVTDEAELPEELQDILYSLLDYCVSEDIEVLFLLNAYYIPEDDQRTYNAVEKIISSYGFPCLNTNEYYEEMGLDFTTDFYDVNHVDCFGAEKYTTFVGNYIVENYDLPDHRGDSEYEDWDESYLNFSENIQSLKSSISSKINARNNAFSLAEELPLIDDAVEWSSYAKDSYFVKLVAWNSSNEDSVDITESDELQLILNNLGISIDVGEVQMVRGKYTISSQQTVSASEYTAELQQSGELGSTSIALVINEDGASILIDDEETCLDREGLNIVIYDNNRKTVIDSVTINSDASGELVLARN